MDSRDTFIQKIRALREQRSVWGNEGDLPILRQFLPHLSEEQIRITIEEGERTRITPHFALPPVHFQEARWAVSYSLHDRDFTQRSVRLSLKPRYAAPPHAPFPTHYREEAKRYALEHWPDSLREGSLQGVESVWVVDPTRLDNSGLPENTHQVFLVLTRDAQELEADTSQSQLELLEEATLEVVVGYQVGSLIEVCGPDHFRAKWWERGYSYHHRRIAVCARDGFGLSYAHCPGCGHVFYEANWRPESYPSVTPSVAAALNAADHVFEADPSVAQVHDKSRWESGQNAHELRLPGRG
jgi:hypothetical protein